MNKELDNVELNLNIDSFKGFAGTSKLKKITLHYIASRLSESEIKDLGNLFK